MDIVPGSLVDQQHLAGEFDLAEVPLDESNLAHRAAVSMVQAHGLTVNDLNLHLHIDKAVPRGRGHGGWLGRCRRRASCRRSVSL